MPRLEKLKKFKIHPAFLLAGVVSALTGGLLDFIVCTLSALIHECAHAFCGNRLGYELNKIILMPYGAVISGDVSGITFKDEVILCLSGPFINLALAVAIVACWWLAPDCYPYTESAFYMNASLFITNMLPAYPLDMGRILFRALSEKISRARAKNICLVISGVTALLSAALFAISCFKTPNFSALFFALFLFFGCFFGEKGEYRKIRFSYKKAFSRGVEVRRVAVGEDTPLKNLIKFFSEDKYLVADIFSAEGEYVSSLMQEQIADFIEKENIYIKIKELLPFLPESALAKSKI